MDGGAQCAHRLLLSYFLSRILGTLFLIAMQSTLYNEKNEISLVEIEPHLGRFKVPQTLRKKLNIKCNKYSYFLDYLCYSLQYLFIVAYFLSNLSTNIIFKPRMILVAQF